MEKADRKRLLLLAEKIISNNKSKTNVKYNLLTISSFKKRVEPWELCRLMGGFQGILTWLLDEEYFIQVKGPDYYKVYFKATRKFCKELKDKYNVSMAFEEYAPSMLNNERAINKNGDLSEHLFGKKKKDVLKILDKIEEKIEDDEVDEKFLDKFEDELDEVIEITDEDKSVFLQKFGKKLISED